MYATAKEYLGIYKPPKSTMQRNGIQLPYGINRGDYGGYLVNETFAENTTRNNVLENTTRNSVAENTTPMENAFVEDVKQDRPVPQDLKWATIEAIPSVNPKLWGPHFWYTYHMSAAYYPKNPSPIVIERMKGRILAIPYEIPCNNCRHHASAFIEGYGDLDNVVSSRDALIKFYVDFHNQVNKRYGKPEWTVEQAKKKYGG